jgi:hypothetical protein
MADAFVRLGMALAAIALVSVVFHQLAKPASSIQPSSTAASIPLAAR